MPLVQGSSQQAISENIHRLSGEIGTSPHVKNHRQAVAIALSVARRNKAAGGGTQPPWYVKSEAKSMAPSSPMHTGAIHSPVPGRTDHIPMRVPSGSYVLPADHVASMGQSNSVAGHAR